MSLSLWPVLSETADLWSEWLADRCLPLVPDYRIGANMASLRDMQSQVDRAVLDHEPQRAPSRKRGGGPGPSRVPLPDSREDASSPQHDYFVVPELAVPQAACEDARPPELGPDECDAAFIDRELRSIREKLAVLERAALTRHR